jgi:phytoene dehydrogenase-like protein
MAKHEVVIVGAGLAGLTCALRLRAEGRDVLVLEASDGPGGRVRTDRVDGFLLDRGFQVLLEAYPTARKYLDYASLDLRPFNPGALIRRGGRFERISDPVRRPQDALATLAANVGGVGDKLRVAKLRLDTTSRSIGELLEQEATTSYAWLRARGFTDGFIDAFFRPFYGGVLLDRGLETTHQMLAFTFKMFAEGDVSIPAGGIGAITDQLALGVGPDAFMYGARVERIDEASGRLELAGGEAVEAEAIVVATDVTQAARLLPERIEDVGWRSTACLYYAAPSSPVGEPTLVLDGEGTGPVNTLCEPSVLSAALAPAGQHLISASVVGAPQVSDAELDAAARDQLLGWFGGEVSEWRLLSVAHVPQAQPVQAPGMLSPYQRTTRVGPALYVCGDHRETSSIEGAMRSGERAAEAYLGATA